jgi:hypothetical protein
MLDFTTGNLMIKRQKLVSTCWLVRKLRTRKTRFPGSSSPPDAWVSAGAETDATH